MRRVVSKALVSVAVLGLSGTAFAADLPRKAPIAAPVAAPVMNWTGFYIGVQGGYTWGQAQIAHSLIVPVPGLAFAVDTAAVTAASSPDIRLRGWNFGGHIGYNVQFSNWLLGLEADGSYFRLRGNVNGLFPFPSTLPGGALGPPTLTFTSATSFETDWLFTFRPRLGVILGDSLLAYITGGLAVTNERVAQTSGVLNAATFNSTIDETRLGWAFGGGLEYALGRNWSIRAEYLHLDFGTATGSGNLVVPAGVLGNAVCATGQGGTTGVIGPATVSGCSISSRLTAEMVRAGISYRFDAGGPVVARY